MSRVSRVKLVGALLLNSRFSCLAEDDNNHGPLHGTGELLWFLFAILQEQSPVLEVLIVDEVSSWCVG